MSAIKIISETQDSVTISRADWRRLLAELEDAEDRAAVTARRTQEKLVGKDAARRDYLTADEARQLLDGINPLRLWREKRGLSQRSLAAEVKMSGSFLAELETGRKRGSRQTLRKLAAALQIDPDDLTNEDLQLRHPEHGPVLLCWSEGSPETMPARLQRKPIATLAEALNAAKADWDRLKGLAPFITDTHYRPIYTQRELLVEMQNAPGGS